MTKRTLFLLAFLLSPYLHAMPEQIFLLRHSEKQSGSNPSLSKEGKQRATRIAQFIAPYQPVHLFSTNYKRTQQTIEPLSEVTKLDVMSYDPKRLAALAQKIQKLEGTVVVVGHSNTTPTLLKFIAGYKVRITEDVYNKVFELRRHNDKYALIRHSSD